MIVIVKDMEMPKACAYCPMLEGDRDDGLCHAASRWLDDDEYWTWYVYPEGDMDLSKPCNCPLVELPPHGRLIDADALMGRIEADTPSSDVFEKLVRRYCNTAPTIIEAEDNTI